MEEKEADRQSAEKERQVALRMKMANQIDGNQKIGNSIVVTKRQAKKHPATIHCNERN